MTIKKSQIDQLHIYCNLFDGMTKRNILKNVLKMIVGILGENLIFEQKDSHDFQFFEVRG